MTRTACRRVADAARGALQRTVAARVNADIKASVGQPLDGTLRDEMQMRIAPARAVPRGSPRGFVGLEAAADSAAGDGRRTEGKAMKGAGSDFSSVRLHCDGHAASASRRLGARAFTIGEHVYLDPGRIPSCPNGHVDLIAHELGHVVQQRELGSRRIQPRLIASGNTDEVERFMRLAEPALGAQLQFNRRSGQITIGAPLPSTAGSTEFAAAMRRIIGNPTQDAEVEFRSGGAGLFVGEFPPNPAVDREQRVGIDDIIAIEAGAPGSGLALLIHELVESFEAHGTPPPAGTNPRDAPHRAGRAIEETVAAQLVGPGRHVAEVGTSTDFIVDYENYFLVLGLRTDSATGDISVTSSRRAARRNVLTRTVQGFAAGASAVPTGGQAAIREVATAAAANVLTTVWVSGFGDDQEAATVSTARADAVTAALRRAGVAGAERIFTRGLGAAQPVVANTDAASRARNRRVVISLDQPAPAAAQPTAPARPGRPDAGTRSGSPPTDAPAPARTAPPDARRP